MNWVRAVVRALGTIVGLCLTAASAYAAGEEARVLILNGVDPYLPAYIAINRAMRETLADQSARRVVLFSEPLDAQRFPVEPLESEYRALFGKKYGALRIDVVVAVTQPALDFFNRNGKQLWPGARLVFHSVSRRDIDPATVPAQATGVTTREDLGGTIDLARRLQPGAHRIVVISGASEFDRRLERDARDMLATKAGALAVDYVSGWSLPELLLRVAAEPKDSIVFYLTQFRDRDGRPYTPREVLRAVSDASAAPVYALFETMMGFGAAAGSTESYQDTGRLVGKQVLSALAGKAPDPGDIVLETSSRCVADARALQHWSLDRDRLPVGCELRFVDRPYWRVHVPEIIAAGGVALGQSWLIAALLLQRRRRRGAESESLKRLSEMAHMNRRVALGEMSASIAHELNQPLGAIRNNVGAAEMMLKAEPPKLMQVAEILADIKRDDQRASDVIARIRKMLSKSAFEVRDMDLNEAVDDTAKLLAEEAAVKSVGLKLHLEAGLPLVSGDRVQLQQVIMNLALNAMEAMQERPAAQRTLEIRSRRNDRREAEVSVTDSGPGIAPALLPHIFDAFVTSRPTGMGLGLAISRTIVEAHGGHITAEHGPTGGAVIRFTVPFAAV